MVCSYIIRGLDQVTDPFVRGCALLCLSFNFSELSLQVVMITLPGSCYWKICILGKNSPTLPRTDAYSTVVK